MKHVPQTGQYNCGSACAAMLTGESIREIEVNYRDPNKDHGDGVIVRKNGIPQEGYTLHEFTFILFNHHVPHFIVPAVDCVECDPNHTWNDPSLAADLINAESLRSIDEWCEYADKFDMAILMGVKGAIADGHWVVYYFGKMHDPKLAHPLKEWDKGNYLVNSELILVDIG